MTAKQRSQSEGKLAALSIYLSGWVPPVVCCVLGNHTHLVPTSGTCVGMAFPFPDVVVLFWVESGRQCHVHLIGSLSKSDHVGAVRLGGREAFGLKSFSLILGPCCHHASALLMRKDADFPQAPCLCKSTDDFHPQMIPFLCSVSVCLLVCVKL